MKNYRNILSIGLLAVLVVSLTVTLTGCGFLGQSPNAKIETTPAPNDSGVVELDVDQDVTFDGSDSEASTDDGDISEYNWTFPGDFNQQTPDGEAVQTGSFTSTGDYSVELEVVDDKGKNDSESVDVEVTS